MKTNYHTHTYRCGHANGNEQEMVQAAIKENFQELGFSCHIPLPYYRLHSISGFHMIKNIRDLKNTTKKIISNGPNMRMPYKESLIHLDIVKKLKEKYKNQITIYQGYEAEYLPDYLKHYQKLLDTNTVDYLILGNHFDTKCVESNYFGRILTDKKIKKYANQVCKAMDTNLFSYIAHPDLFMNRNHQFNETCTQAAIDICTKAKETNTPLEINGGGLRAGKSMIGGVYRYRYPVDPFWNIASQIGAPIVIGIDAHAPDEFNESDYQELIKYAQKFNLTITNKITFKKGKSSN